MNKLEKLVKGIQILLKKPSLINLLINQNENWKDKTSNNYQNGFNQVALNEIFPQFNGELDTVAFLDGGSMITDLLLLKNACIQFEDCKYFEIGTWRGESIINLINVAKDLNTLDLGANDFKKFNLSQAYADAHGFFIKNNSKIKQHLGDSTQFDFAGLNQKFDVIFIDGNHEYDFVVSDTRNVFKHLVHENSIVIWHDYAYSPEKIRYEILNAILDGTPTEMHKNLYHVENTMCAIYHPKNFETRLWQEYENPRRTFRANIQINSL
ncbi:MAG: class I SAM-dependent methyltransferase [Weeksellaceae bacterium]|nr:class I SAM-dependent methyltransferase [Weeksellaceae bacterium]